MRKRKLEIVPIAAIAAAACMAVAHAQMPGVGQMSGGRPSMNGRPSDELDSSPATVKPDVAATKAYNAGMKSLDKAKEYDAAALQAPNADKKAKAAEKASDAYNRALDLFTEALSSKSDLVDAWNGAGTVHLRLGAYAEALDDYNHALALKPDLTAAIERRAEAYLALNRLEESKSAYMDLFNHERALANQLMLAMRQWLAEHRADAGGVSGAEWAAFDQWVKEREGIAKETALVPAADRRTAAGAWTVRPPGT